VVTLRNFEPHELGRLREIDRSEEITLSYRVADGVLISETVDWRAKPWLPEQVEGYVGRYGPEIEVGGLCAVAEDPSEGGRLAGAAILGSHPVQAHPGLLQLLFFHVSRPYRREGVGGQLFRLIETEAQHRGAAGLYISAAPTGSAVGFYLSRGAELITPDPALLAEEPEDIHLAVIFGR